MKNNHTLFFLVGIIVGAGMMVVTLDAPQIKALLFPEPENPIVSTPKQFPQLIALESEGVGQIVTPTFALPPASTKAELPEEPTALHPESTPLSLPNEQRSEIIGYSVEGRPLQVYSFGKGEREIMVVAGIHGGDEWNTITLANLLIAHFNQNPQLIVNSVTLYVLPNLNPDGEARSHDKYGRLNHNGVDLNRNFSVNWKEDWDRAGCWNSLPTSGGTGPGSEAETQALMNFISNHHIQALISYHSAALGIFPGGLPWDQNSTRLAESLAEVTSYSFPPLDTGCVYSGTLADYAVAMGAAAVDLELTNHFSPDFDQNLQALDVLMNFVP